MTWLPRVLLGMRGAADLDTDEQPGFEGIWVTVCAACDSVYDPETGDLLARSF